MLGAPTRKVLAAATTKATTAATSAAAATRRPLQPFLLERFDGWNDGTLSLSSSECEPLSLQELLSYADNEGQEKWDKLSLGYVEPSNGSLYLRRQVLQAQHFLENDSSLGSLDNNEDCVNICAPQEGIFLAIQALCSPGDHVVVVAPAYQSLHEIASSLGCHVTSWWPEPVQVVSEGVDEDDNAATSSNRTLSWRFNPETLEKLIRPNQTKLVVANFPHNPTGALPSPAEYQKMIDIVQDHGAWFLVDEMYRGLEHIAPTSGEFVAPLPPVAACMPRGISLGGLSKSYGLPGLRIGWLVNGQVSTFQKRVNELKDYTIICPPAPSEALAFVALRAQEALWQRSRTIVAQGLPVLRQFIQNRRQTFTWCEPLGGTFAWVKLNNRDGESQISRNEEPSLSASQYCNTLRQRTGLMIVPSGLFPECKENDDYLRLTFGKKGLDQLLQVWDRDLQQFVPE